MALSAPDEGLLRAARALDRSGRQAEASRAYQEILARWPDLPDCWYRLGYLQRRMGQFTQALDSYQQALDRGVSQPEEVHLNRGVIYSSHLNNYEAAEQELLTALRLQPGYSSAWLNLANLYEDQGRREAARAAYERLLEIAPGNHEALARYANATSFSNGNDPLIARLRRSLTVSEISVEERASLGFALGRALDGVGEYPGAFEAYSAANRASRAAVPPGIGRYDRQSQERFIDRLIAAFPGGAPPANNSTGSSQAASPSPVFICGMFRSGSTLTEQLLAGHARVSAGGELELLPNMAREALQSMQGNIDSLPASRLQMLAAHYTARLAQLFPGSELVTDKRPDNFLYIGLIKRLFPHARIIQTTRDPLDNCLSIFFLHLDQRLSYALDLLDTGHYYREYLRLMAHWKAAYAKDIFEVHYDSLVREPRRVIGELLDFLDLEWDNRCIAVPPSGRPIRTASVWQVREPIYQSSSGRSRHYREQLAALGSYLGL